MECRKKDNLKYCNCSYSACDKKGICCECITYHRDRKELPGCYFPSSAERTYDRSIEHFIKMYKA